MAQTLEGSNFNYSVDLGCGYGLYGPLFKSHTKYLVGVDKKPYLLVLASLLRGYDELVCSDFRSYTIPPQCDSIFMIESLEHIIEEDGTSLLNRIGYRRTTLLTTPMEWLPGAFPFMNGHLSLWTPGKLQGLGFEVYSFEQPIVKGILAIRRKNDSVGRISKHLTKTNYS